MAGLDSFVKLYSNYNSAVADNWNSKTLTANGSAQIDTSIKKFGAGSLLLASATSDFVSISDDSDFDLGSGDFAFDLQGRFVSLPTSGNRMCLFSSWNDTTDEGYKLCVYNNSGVYELEWSYTTDGSTEKKQNVNYNFAIDTFYHIAVCRNTTSLGLFVNGANIGGYYVGTDTIRNSSEDFKIGAYNATEISFFDGYVDEFRFSKGTARYTTNSFTPPTSNATADSSDVALLHMDGSDASQDFVDDSLFAEPIFGTGMGKFDGNSDYLTVASHVDFNYGTGDFALESRVFFKSFPQANNMIIDQRDIAVSPLLYVSNTGILYYFVNGANRINGGSVISLNTWYHVAVARSSGTTKLFLDGTQVGSSYTDSNNYGQTSVTIAKSLTAGDYSDIFIDDLRISKGAARYTTNFTVPSSELTNDGNTSLLLNCNGADESTTFTDSSTTGHTVTANGTAQISDGEGKVITVYGNAQMKTSDGGISPKSGTAMGKFDGTGDNLSFADASDINFSNNNFLIESWVNVSTFPTAGNSQVISSQSLTGNLDLNYIFGINNDSGNYRCFFAFSYNGTTQRIFYAYFPLSSATWYHISVFRISDTIYLSVDGNIISSFYVSTNSLYDSPEIVYIGCRFFVSRTDFLNGYMDEFRISNGNARRTPTSFTPPVAEYSSGDITAPTISTLSPQNGGQDVSVLSNLVATFDENVTAVTGNDVIIKRYADDSVVETIDAADAKITISGAEVTINPATQLDYDTRYYVIIEAGAFEDASSNAFAGILTNAIWNFTTEIYGFGDAVIEVNGTDYTSQADMKSIKIITQDNFSNSASVNIVLNSNAIKMGMELIIRNTTTSEILFGGLIQQPQKVLLSPDFMVLKIYAEGYKQILGRRTFEVDAQNELAGDIVSQIFTDFIKVGSSTSEELTEGNIDDGITVENYKKVAETGLKIYNDLANSSGFKWWVTNEKAFYFQDAPTYTDNTLTKCLTPDSADARYIKCVGMPTFSEDTSKFRTRQFVFGKKLEDSTVLGSYADTTTETAMSLRYGSGVFGAVLTNQNISTDAEADDMAETEVKTYVNPASISFKTYDKIDVLELIKVDIDLLDISEETYKITKVTKTIDPNFKILSQIVAEKYVVATKQKRAWTDEFDEMLKNNTDKATPEEKLYDEYGGGTITAAASDTRTITVTVDTDKALHTHYTIVGTCAGAGTVTVTLKIDAVTKKTYVFDVVAGNFSKTLAYPIQVITTSGSSSVTALTATTVNLVVAANDLSFWVETN